MSSFAGGRGSLKGCRAMRTTCRHSVFRAFDDAQGERIEVLWDAEIGAAVLDEDGWRSVGTGLPDRAEVLAAQLRAIRWRSATAADRDLLQAPFRAGIRLDAYQLLPLRKALRLPRVNLLIADDVGLGKTVEAGLITRELLLRRRIDFIVIAAPPAMTIQWKDELEAKFGLSFASAASASATGAEMRRCGRSPSNLQNRTTAATLPMSFRCISSIGLSDACSPVSSARASSRSYRVYPSSMGLGRVKRR